MMPSEKPRHRAAEHEEKPEIYELRSPGQGAHLDVKAIAQERDHHRVTAEEDDRPDEDLAEFGSELRSLQQVGVFLSDLDERSLERMLPRFHLHGHETEDFGQFP